MQERQVTLADTTFPLDDPFWVLATQNPVEQEGVYTLPEAQLDRFSMMLRVGYPSQGEEVEMLQMRMNQTTIVHRVSPSDVTRPARLHRPGGLHRPEDPRVHRPARPRHARPGERRPRRPARAARARHFAALLPAPAGVEPGDGIPPRPHLGAAGRRQGNLLPTRPATASRAPSARRRRTCTPTRSSRSCWAVPIP